MKNPLEGYRRLTFMMLDSGIVAVSPSRVWRILGQAGLLAKWKGKPSKKGTGFEQPLKAHEHWHIDVSYINISGTFYYLCSVLDGYSRAIVHWALRESMTEAEVEVILQAAKEKYPDARPRIISDNGPQFIARDFKEFIRISGMTHVRTSPYSPQAKAYASYCTSCEPRMTFCGRSRRLASLTPCALRGGLVPGSSYSQSSRSFTG